MTGVGVIGTGFMGVAHTEALRRLGLDVVGIVGSSPERARAKAATAPLPPVVDSVEELVSDPSVDAVHVTSPNHLHAAHVRAALAAGKHVVCEKPLGVSVDETAELVALGRATPVSSTRSASTSASTRRTRTPPPSSRPGRSASHGSSPGATTRTGCSSRPTGTGASTAAVRVDCAPWPTSGHTGSTSPAS